MQLINLSDAKNVFASDFFVGPAPPQKAMAPIDEARSIRVSPKYAAAKVAYLLEGHCHKVINDSDASTAASDTAVLLLFRADNGLSEVCADNMRALDGQLASLLRRRGVLPHVQFVPRISASRYGETLKMRVYLNKAQIYYESETTPRAASDADVQRLLQSQFKASLIFTVGSPWINTYKETLMAGNTLIVQAVRLRAPEKHEADLPVVEVKHDFGSMF